MPSGSQKVFHFICNFDCSYLVTDPPCMRSDLLHLHKVDTGEILPRPVNIEKVVVVPEFFSTNLRPHDEILVEPDMDPNAEPGHAIPNSDLVSVAFEFGKYLKTLPNNLLCLHKHVTFLWVSPLHSRNTRMPWPSYRSC